MSSLKPEVKAKVTRYTCPVEGCDVAVYATWNEEKGRTTVTDFRCDRQGECAIPFYDPCPLYIDLVEKRGIRHLT